MHIRLQNGSSESISLSSPPYSQTAARKPEADVLAALDPFVILTRFDIYILTECFILISFLATRRKEVEYNEFGKENELWYTVALLF